MHGLNLMGNLAPFKAFRLISSFFLFSRLGFGLKVFGLGHLKAHHRLPEEVETQAIEVTRLHAKSLEENARNHLGEVSSKPLDTELN
jgi:hypothetical protein